MGKHYDVLSRRPSSLPLRLCAVFFAQSRPSCSFLEQSREVGVRSKLIRPGLTPEPTALEIGVQQTKTASGKLTINSCSFNGTVGQVSATMAITSPISMTVPYSVTYTYGN